MDRLFTVHKLNNTGMENAKLIANCFDTLLKNLEMVCSRETREFGRAIVKLEEACFLAKKAMAINPQNQEIVQPSINVVETPIEGDEKNIRIETLDGERVKTQLVSKNEYNTLIKDKEKLWFSQESKDRGDFHWRLVS